MKTKTDPSAPSSARDKLLFTPGPLTTSHSVKEAMLHDAGSWHFEFNAVVASVRERLLQLGGVSRGRGYEAVLLQGSGTFGVEAVFQTCVPAEGKVAVLSNGAYGERMIQMLKHARIAHLALRTGEDTPSDPAALDRALAADPAITHVAAVHCETTTGVLNPIDELGHVTHRHGRTYVVDAMSSFGALPIDLAGWHIDFLISSANKCIEGVPGFSFVLCRRDVLLACEGIARSLSMDLIGQLKGFEKNGQFRYTPPTHAILAFSRALDELEAEGGPAARCARYMRNHQTLVTGMRALGFRPYLDPAVQSCIITSFLFPPDPEFDFDTFYRRLSDKGFIIYPGKISQADTFRIGSIGRIFEADIQGLLAAVQQTVNELGILVETPTPPPAVETAPSFS
ncbi:MAG TPA: 2-aminoethylphosphonate--pyruvate transaminase [Verrucomicrobiales bacterium]|nr:2-aminoethylphosphonate--pyruvate transaminase [Verrucomicrobiales bacterium]